MSYTNTHTTSDVGPEKLRKRRISNHDEKILRIKPLTVKHREKPSKYCVNFSSLNKMYCVSIRLIGVFHMPHEK